MWTTRNSRLRITDLDDKRHLLLPTSACSPHDHGAFFENRRGKTTFSNPMWLIDNKMAHIRVALSCSSLIRGVHDKKRLKR